jgi:hypothetical protein
MPIRAAAAEPCPEVGEDSMSGEGWLSMRYRDFYDVPRLVVVEYGGRLYLLDSPFDEESDDYAEHYTIYRLPEDAVAMLEEPSWERLPSIGEEMGRVRVTDVEFDQTKRGRLNPSLFRRLGIE